jgi:hypothetical protein
MPQAFDDNGKRTPYGYAAIAVMACIWFGVSVWLPGLGILVAGIHAVCIVGDLLMNGNPNSDLLGPNLGGALLAGAGAWYGLALHAA